ncbi:MAG: hypothetical protein A3G49_04585 [Candidatus Sungbacteria bacterium RIFCSPLOWO2_12_FULL_41_11]|uniref:Uncharacterized protein n=1 Tax=Candidatus Sungbacteria bacterium RIFCSPLOWO2_12_FULL_41_11 TaxID=1802286 RepID=A0A1G2LQP8_9BACT|nr:MAG: hypothetical protein UV01_C0018G0025 [Parcubacteria group bacterium GW2011_GWA2_42_14]OGZ98918.1 MAG: hypothetical protein A3D41_02115 [Candidatus Sungbacteria bacterium RIFCSPHIGHO2_02_FULL_41_12b]OHA13854.1 MAG: hypothetical protein A3G49_04585 [Candidatus Sungbacteria bacterium RIFCSPLOWO2_12_FULL_41_11]
MLKAHLEKIQEKIISISQIMKYYKYILTAVLLLLPLISFAAMINPIKYGSFLDIFKALTGFLKTFGGPVAIIMFLYGGFLYLTSGGSQEKVKMANQTMTWSAVGLGVIYIGSAFVSIICAFLETTSCPV